MPDIVESSDFGREIERRRNQLGWSRPKLEEESGVSQRAIRAYEREGQEPSASKWRKIDHALRAAEGEGTPSHNGVPAPGDNGPSGEVEVWHFGYVGAGRTGQETTTITVTRREYVSRFGARAPDEVGVWEVDGDSAVPAYYDGEMVPVEVRDGGEQFNDDALYVFRRGESILLKRLRRLEDGRVLGESLNPSVRDLTVDPQVTDFAVLGKVLDNHKQQLHTALVGRFMRTDDV